MEIDESLCLKYSLCKSAAAYTKLVASLQQTLGIQCVLGTKELAIQYGCIQANDLAKRVLQSYKEKIRASIPNATSSNAASTVLDTRSVYPCVAFYLSCRHMKIVGVDRKRLVSSAAVSEREFLQVVDSFYTHIPELKPPERKAAAAGTNGKGRKRKQKADEEGNTAEGQHEQEDEADEDEEKDGADEHDDDHDDDADADADDAAADDDAAPSLSGGKRLGYEKWKQKVMKEAREESSHFMEPLAKVTQTPPGQAPREIAGSPANEPHSRRSFLCLFSFPQKHKSVPSSSARSTSASPADSDVALGFLRQSKLSFGGKSTRDESDDEGEAELE